MRTLLTVIVCLVAIHAALPSLAQEERAKFDHEHAALTAVLRKHLHGELVDYAALKKDRAGLDAYLRSLAAVTQSDMKGWTREQRYAFWINAYNAFTLQIVIDNYPVKSIKDIGGIFTSVWDKAFIPMRTHHPKGKDRDLTLNHIEHEILRPTFKDARVHAAINCASASCPPLRQEAFVAARLNEQLDEQVRTWLADPRRNEYDRESNTLRLSRVFDWFEEDFERDGGSVQAWVAQFAPEAEAAWIRAAQKIRVRHLEYSWKLNEVRKD